MMVNNLDNSTLHLNLYLTYSTWVLIGIVFISGALEAVNGVDSVDYTGFSLLGEDLLGDLFGGSSGGKKTNKNRNKNKQAPIISTTTRRPRPSRRPTIRPFRTTTLRPTTAIRTTTVRVRPISRRPTRRPARRPARRTTTVSSIQTEESSTLAPISTTVPVKVEEIKLNEPLNENAEISHSAEVHQVIPITQKPLVSPEPTSPSVTTFEDAGLEMSLAHITGQLSLMPVTQLKPTEIKDTSEQIFTEKMPTNEEVTYEQVQTITSKPHSTIPYATVVDDDSNEDMVQIVQTLDSHSEEHATEHAADSENVIEDNRSHKDNTPSHHYEGLSLPKKKHRGFRFDDLDVLDLTGIGESVGQQLGIFGRHKRQNRNKETKPHDIKGVSDYDDLLGLDALSESMGLPDIDDLSRKDRRRQNKMMRGLWPSV